jgi:hypothetical protein
MRLFLQRFEILLFQLDFSRAALRGPAQQICAGARSLESSILGERGYCVRGLEQAGVP